MSEIKAFTAEHVRRLTGLSDRQLRYWDKTEFFSPRYADPNSHRPFSRIYSFQDLVGLRTIALLRNEYHVPLQELREVGRWLAERHDTPWSSLTFYVVGRRVYFDDPETEARTAGRPIGQTALPFQMEKIANRVREDTERLRGRSAEQLGHIKQSRYVAHNAPVLDGTRIPTSAVWNFHRAGYDTAAIIREYPTLTPEDIDAAIAYEEQRQQRRAG